MKVKICKYCGAIKMSEQGCPICQNNNFEDSELPNELTCPQCKKIWKTEDILEEWITPPFYNAKDNTFYDGCGGWD